MGRTRTTIRTMPRASSGRLRRLRLRTTSTRFHMRPSPTTTRTWSSCTTTSVRTPALNTRELHPMTTPMSHSADAPLAVAEHPHDPLVAEQFEDLDQQHQAGTLGMWTFLATEVLFFGGMICGYVIYRHLYFEAWHQGSVV